MRILTIALLVLVSCHSISIAQSDVPQPTRSETYKTVSDTKLQAHLYLPENNDDSKPRPAVVFFFGGGWRAGSPTQFARHAAYLAKQGLVAITVDYRVQSRHQSTATQSVADAKSAIRWVRHNAKRLGVDPNRIAAAGGSAGGHLAAAVATLPDWNEPGESTDISCIPNACLLFNPALDLSAQGFHRKPDDPKQLELLERLGTTPPRISPLAHVGPKQPPTIIFHGEDDPTVPIDQARHYEQAMRRAGNRCELKAYPHEVHGFFNFGKNGNKAFVATLTESHNFLRSLGWLNSTPSVEEFVHELR